MRRKTDRSRKGGSGVRTKYHRFAGLLLAIVLMIAGICGDTLKVDAAFMRATENTKTSCIEASRAVLTGAECCTAEMLGIRRNTEVRSAALCQVNPRRGLGLSFGFLCQTFFSLGHRDFRMGLQNAVSVLEDRDGLVADYIHKSDGKKRI